MESHEKMIEINIHKKCSCAIARAPSLLIIFRSLPYNFLTACVTELEIFDLHSTFVFFQMFPLLLLFQAPLRILINNTFLCKG